MQSAERGMRNAERPRYTTFRSQGKNDKCGARNVLRTYKKALLDFI